MMPLEPLKPKRLKAGDTIGIFTPSSPAYIDCEGLFTNGIRNLEACGFKSKQGHVTSRRMGQGYRSASPQDRAKEFMDLILDPDVHGLMSTIGGYNSSSMIPYLDFQAIRASRKPICGYSDVTSLHASILTAAGLRTFYGPSVMCWFGDWPDGIPETTRWFLDAPSGKSITVVYAFLSVHENRSKLI
jgi:muramoyltetrapeptide carboxypeptidase